MLITINIKITKNFKHQLVYILYKAILKNCWVHDNTIFTIFLTPPTPIFFAQKKGGHRKNIEKSCTSCTYTDNQRFNRVLIVYQSCTQAQNRVPKRAKLLGTFKIPLLSLRTLYIFCYYEPWIAYFGTRFLKQYTIRQSPFKTFSSSILSSQNPSYLKNHYTFAPYLSTLPSPQ